MPPVAIAVLLRRMAIETDGAFHTCRECGASIHGLMTELRHTHDCEVAETLAELKRQAKVGRDGPSH